MIFILDRLNHLKQAPMDSPNKHTTIVFPNTVTPPPPPAWFDGLGTEMIVFILFASGSIVVTLANMFSNYWANKTKQQSQELDSQIIANLNQTLQNSTTKLEVSFDKLGNKIDTLTERVTAVEAKQLLYEKELPHHQKIVDIEIEKLEENQSAIIMQLNKIELNMSGVNKRLDDVQAYLIRHANYTLRGDNDARINNQK